MSRHDLRKRLAASRHWIFDLDGTLTVPVHDFAFIRRDLAVPDGTDILSHLETLPEKEAGRMRQRLEEIEAELLEVTEPSPGLYDLLDHLAAAGASMGILTRNSRDVARRTLEKLGISSLFTEETIIGRDEARPKPEPEGILRLAGTWAVYPEATVMVGDYLYDLQAGRKAGSLTVHVDSSAHFRWPDLADFRVPDLAELLRLFDPA